MGPPLGYPPLPPPRPVMPPPQPVWGQAPRQFAPPPYPVMPPPRRSGNGPILAYCQEQARQLVAALRDLELLQPAEMEGLLKAAKSR